MNSAPLPRTHSFAMQPTSSWFPPDRWNDCRISSDHVMSLKGTYFRAPSWASKNIQMFDVLPCVIRLFKVGILFCALFHRKSFVFFLLFDEFVFHCWWSDELIERNRNDKTLYSRFFLRKVFCFVFCWSIALCCIYEAIQSSNVYYFDFGINDDALLQA